MASEYIYNSNPFKDFLLQSLMYGVDLSQKEVKSDIYTSFTVILENILNNRNDIVHLDFDITGNIDNIKLIGKNAVSALWLSGIFPENINFILKNNDFNIGNRMYNYDNKTCNLTYKIIKENE